MTNLSPLYGTASQSITPRENIGVVDNIKDGNDSTVYGFLLSNNPVSGPLLPWYVNYQISLNSGYYVDNVVIKHSHSGGTPDSASGWLTKVDLGIAAIGIYNNLIPLGNSNLYSPFENTYSVQQKIKSILIIGEIDGSMGRAGSESFYLLDAYINGVARAASQIKIQSLSGVQTIAKNTELYGPLRYRSTSGVESLAIVETDDSKATNIRIKTASGIKALAKL